MKLLRLVALAVAAGGCSTPPSVVRTDAAADAGGAAGSGNDDAGPTDGPRERGGGGDAGAGTAGAGGHAGSGGPAAGGAGGNTGGNGGRAAGTAGTAGTAGAGGNAGVGAAGNAGAAGAAGVGVAGSSGDGAAGSAGDGGTTSSGTDVGQDGAAPLDGTPLATFDTDLNGFVIDTYHDTLPLTNLGDPASGLPAPSLAFDATTGSPTGGSMRVVAPYSGPDQYVDLQKVLGAAGLQNWTGKKLHVRLRVDSGSIFVGTAQLYVDTTSAYVFAGTSFGVAAGSEWQELVLDLNAPAVMVSGYDPSEVILFGVQLETPADDTGATPVTFHIDSFSLE